MPSPRAGGAAIARKREVVGRSRHSPSPPRLSVLSYSLSSRGSSRRSSHCLDMTWGVSSSSLEQDGPCRPLKSDSRSDSRTCDEMLHGRSCPWGLAPSPLVPGPAGTTPTRGRRDDRLLSLSHGSRPPLPRGHPGPGRLPRLENHEKGFLAPSGCPGRSRAVPPKRSDETQFGSRTEETQRVDPRYSEGLY